MLSGLFARPQAQYPSLPLFGPLLDEFARLDDRPSCHRSLVCRQIRTTGDVDRPLQACGCNDLEGVDREQLDAIRPKTHKTIAILPPQSACWERYLEERTLLSRLQPDPNEVLATEYRQHLEAVRGVSESTLNQHKSTVLIFSNKFPPV